MKIINGKIYLKVLFFGTALAGKTTILEWLFNNIIPKEMKLTEKINSVKTSFGQTLLFDFVPIQIGENVIVRFYTSTGQDYYTSTRKMLVENVDGIFFVVDSQKKELEHNEEFLREFNRYIENSAEKKDIEVIILYNKQDLKDIYSPEYLETELNIQQYLCCPTCGLTGTNLEPAFTVMLSRILKKLKERKN